MTQKIASDFNETLLSTGKEAIEFSPAAEAAWSKISRKLPFLLIGAGVAVLAAADAALAQPALGADTVVWSATAPSQSVKAGGKVKVTLRGAVQSGWHVYGLQQLPDGPTPLRITFDASEVAAADGQPTASPPTKLQDPSFNLETQYYEHDFTVTAPVRIGAHAAAGQQQIPISVRFQTCNGHICQPPKTAHLSVPVTIRANG
jgi:DsbC/DsbD-like thiol-disulfide interchange protein